MNNLCLLAYQGVKIIIALKCWDFSPWYNPCSKQKWSISI